MTFCCCFEGNNPSICTFFYQIFTVVLLILFDGQISKVLELLPVDLTEKGKIMVNFAVALSDRRVGKSELCME